ncbi:MAG: DUF1232 domain-containing protein [Anaerolineales bacterium]|nr:DUF1232 domain-containing protein [Anaerolineales bacterium]
MSDEKALTVKKDPGFWRELWQQARLVWHLFLDPEVPIYLKILPLLTLAYLFVPIDLLPDVLIGLGQLDDLTVMMVGSKIFIELVPPHVAARHMQAIRERDGYLQPADAAADEDAALADKIVIDADHEVVSKEDGEQG